MNTSRRFKRPPKPKAPRTFTPEQLEDWLDSLDPPAAGVSMIDGYLAALVVSPQFIPPEDWLPTIVGDRIVWALEGTVEATVRNTLFQRYNKISSTLTGGTQRYAPIYMRTDDGEVLLEEFANGFYFGMQLAIDAWLPFLRDPEIGLAIVAILGHRLKESSTGERIVTVEAQTAELLAESWRIVPELVEMLHLKLAGFRNIEIR